jgi:hypothetical protein
MFKVWAKTSVSRRKTKHDRAIRKVTLSSPCLWASFHPPILSFSGIRKVRTFLLNVSIKCCNSVRNAQHLMHKVRD